MIYFLVIAGLAFGVGLFFKILNDRGLNFPTNQGISMEKPLWIGAETHQIAKEFHIKESLFTKTELALFYEIRRQLPPHYYVFPNMRMADILTTTKDEGYKRRVYKMLPKHIDFVVANQYFKPVLAIELNGASHNNYKQKQSDAVKNEIFSNAGLPLETIRVGEQYSEIIAAVFKKNLPTK